MGRKLQNTFNYSKNSAYKIWTPGNYPEESIQHSEHGESLKSRNRAFMLVIVNKYHCMKCCECKRSNDQYRALCPTIPTEPPNSFPGPVFLIPHLATV